MAADGSGWRKRETLTVSERVRGEFVDWFRPPAGVASRRLHHVLP
jgi:hypothetical protein